MPGERDRPVVRRLDVSSSAGRHGAPAPAWRARATAVALVVAAVTLDGDTYDLLPVPPDYRRYRYLALTSGRAVALFVRVDELV
jgi:hypothetical protein